MSGDRDKHLRVLAAAFIISQSAHVRFDINSRTESGVRMLSATDMQEKLIKLSNQLVQEMA